MATGVVLGAALGAAALFLYLGTLHTATTGASFTVLFGSIFVVSPDTVPALVASGVIALLVAVLSRVLLLTSVSPDLARARGVNVRLVGIAYLGALAVSVSLAAVAIGAVLSTALLIGPSATALRITKSPGRAMAVSALDRPGRDVARHRARLRLVLLAAARPRLAGVVLRRRRSSSPATCSATCSRPRRGAALAARGGRMFTGLMLNTWIAASIVAVIAGITGFFAVLRGQTFAAHAIPNGAFAGAAGASLLGINVIWGLAVFAIGGALGIGALGTEGSGRKARNDVVTALAPRPHARPRRAVRQREQPVRRGDLRAAVRRGIRRSARARCCRSSASASSSALAIGGGFRPLMLTSALPEVAEARGVSTRRADLYFLIVMALATSMTVPVVGALLMFSLMIGPAAAARSVTARPGTALALSVVIALATVWLSIALSYRDELAAWLFRRHHRRRLLPARPGRTRGGSARPGSRAASSGPIATSTCSSTSTRAVLCST